jgi:hypothetical protein
MTHTIEQYLMTLTGLINKQYNFCLLDGDSVILTSIARQLNKGVAMTDRQYSLVKSKLVNYKDQFEKNNMNHLDQALTTVAQPLRTIDRSQTVSVEDGWLVVKFPFNKKTISQLDSVATKYRRFYKHDRGSNVHHFKMYEPAINEIVELFKGKSFEISPELFDISNEVETIKSQELSYIPHISDQGLTNLPDHAVEFIQNDLGNLEENKIKYWDRSIRYGYKKTAQVFKDHSQLAEHIANRTSQKIYLNPSAYTINDIANAVNELDRFPLLVALNRGKEFEEIKFIVDAFDFVDPSEQILLNRIENTNDSNYAINKYIKDKNFNNWLDSNIKIVYIFKNNIPKLLLKNEWQPTAYLTLNGEREASQLATYTEQHCDLMMLHDSQHSTWTNPIARQLIQWA